MELYEQEHNGKERLRDRDTETIPSPKSLSGAVEQLLRIQAKRKRVDPGNFPDPEITEQISRCFALSETEQKLLNTFASLQI